MPQKLYAFARDIEYPYFIGYEVSELVNNTGRVRIRNKVGTIIEPTLVVPLERGLELQKRLDCLKSKLDVKQEKLLTKFKKKLNFMYMDQYE